MKIDPVPLVLVMPLYWLCLCNHIFDVSGLCLGDQKSLLLQLKNNLSFWPGSSTELESWDPSDDDCCAWMKVACDKEGHVTGLDFSGESISGGFDNLSSIFSLQHLTNLNLAYNDLNSLIPFGFNKLKNLAYLNLSTAGFQGDIPTEISQLHNLSILILDNNYFSSVPETFANLKNLTILSLVHTNLIGQFPPKIFQIETLSFIDISDNPDLHGFFPDFPASGSLKTIRVSDTNFSGTLPHSIGNLRHLSKLDFYNCQFSGTLPNSVSNLIELTYLYFSYNKFTGSLPSFSMAKNLIHLDFSYNDLSGAIPSSHFEALHNLFYIDLTQNYITGSIPSSLFKLNALQTLRLSSNKFNGSIQLHKLWELRNLTYLEISYNNLSINVDMTNVSPSPLPNLQGLYLSSCNLKTFPDFLRNHSNLQYLDLSNNQIQGTVPNWLWKLKALTYFDILSNFLNDLEEPMLNNISSLTHLDLHNNQLEGPLPIFPVQAEFLDYSRNRFSSVIPQDIGNYLPSSLFLSLSDNKFHGNIPHSLCNATNLEVLDLSFNNFFGTIPSCLMTMTILGVLKLRNNNLTGHIPNMFPSSCAIRTLDLHGNLLDGPIPKSLANCSILEVLDIGKNHISGGFPCFLKNTFIKALVLRNNNFQGSLECEKTNNTPWKMLQIVDIACNNFSGKLKGSYFKNWETMMQDVAQLTSEYGYREVFVHNEFTPGIYYQDSVTVINKGLQMELVKILTVFTSIDFSSNLFEGPIPEELMDFRELIVLNLSNNALSGEIPSSIGNLKQLESLDLSQNTLHGEIPVKLASLTFLSYLNLSFNHLVGMIPIGTQLQSFPASSFEGNDGLHGPPADVKPDGKNPGLLPQPLCKRLACSVDWNFLSAELGFAFGLGIVIGPILFGKQWRIWY